MNEKENVGSRGRDVQGEEQDGKHAEGTKDGRGARIRRATFDDLNAIIDINDNVYEGFDYMPALFYTFMHSKLHVIYVHEEDGKLVSLYNIRFHPDRHDLISGMSGRVRPSYQGRGYSTSDAAPLRTHFMKMHPLIKRFVADTMYTPNIAAKMKNWKLLYHWNMLKFKVADRQWLSRFTRIRQMERSAIRPSVLSYSDGTEWLERSDQLIRFVSKYVQDLFPIGPSWMPTPTNKSGLRYLLSVAKVHISLDPASTVENSYSSEFSSHPGHLPTEGSLTQKTRDREQEGSIIGLSYSTVVPCKYGVRIDIYFYGDCQSIFLSHVFSHLLHYVSITSDDVRFGMQLHFPLAIQSKYVEERLKEDLGVCPDIVSQAVQYIAELPQAKL